MSYPLLDRKKNELAGTPIFATNFKASRNMIQNSLVHISYLHQVYNIYSAKKRGGGRLSKF